MHLQCEKCWRGSGNLQGHRGRHCLTPQERRDKRNKIKRRSRKRKRFNKPV